MNDDHTSYADTPPHWGAPDRGGSAIGFAILWSLFMVLCALVGLIVASLT